MTTRRVVILLVIGGLVLRVAIVLMTRAYAFPQLWEFDPLAKSIVGGRGYVYATPWLEYRGIGFPLYTYLTAAVYSLFGAYRYVVMLSVQTVFALGLALIAHDLGRHFSEKVGLIAMGLVVTHPGLLYYETQTLHSLTFTAFLVGASVWTFVLLSRQPTMWRTVASGMVVGLTMLSHSTIGLFVVPAWFLAVRYAKCAVRTASRYIAVFLLVVSSVMAPWVIRNYLVFGEVILVSTASGETLWRGNNRYSTGTSRAETGEPVLEVMPEEFRHRVLSLSEVERDRFFKREAYNFILSRPGDALELFGRKLFAFWWFSPQSGEYYPSHYLASYKIYYGALLLLSVVGFAGLTVEKTGAHPGLVAGMLATAFVTLSVGQSLFYVEGRHRWNIEALLLIMSAVGMLTMARALGYAWRPGVGARSV